MTDAPPIVLTGATGDMSRRIVAALCRHGMAFRALLRPGNLATAHVRLTAAGAAVVEVDRDDADALRA